MTPSTQLAQRIAHLFNRRLTTAWSAKEIKAYKILISTKALYNMADVELIERYYKAERAKGDKGIHRRDLQTFLNNFPSELDRARAWQERAVETQKRNRPRQPEKQKEVSDEEFGRIRDFCRKEMDRFKEQMKNVKSQGFTISSETTMWDDLKKSKIKD